MIGNSKVTALLEEIEAFSAIPNLQDQCIRAYDLNKKISGHLQLEALAERIAAKRPVSSTSENAVKNRLLAVKAALEPYQQLQECYLTMQRLERLGINNPAKQLEALQALQAKLPHHKANEVFNSGVDEFKAKVESRINFIAAVQQYHEKFNDNLSKIMRTKDPVKRAERIARYQSTFMRSCERNIDAQGFEAEFATQKKLWAYQFQQLDHYSKSPLFSQELPNFKKLDSAWRHYLLASPLALEERAAQLEKVQGLLEENAQQVQSQLQESSTRSNSASPSNDTPDDSVSYQMVQEVAQTNDNEQQLEELYTKAENLSKLQDAVDDKLQEIQFVLQTDKPFHDYSLTTTNLQPALGNVINTVTKMQLSDVGESLDIAGQLKHIAEDAQLEAIDVMHRSFTIPGPNKGLVDNWHEEVKKNPNTPPFFTWLQIAPAYKDLEWHAGPNNGMIFRDDARLSGMHITGVRHGKGRVVYLNAEQREQRLLTVDNGILRDNDNHLADTQLKRTQNFGSGTATFVVSPSGKLYIGEHIPGEEYHSTLLSGGSARCAGMIKIDNGKIDWITNKTGHYRTGNAELVAEILRLQNQGLDLSTTKARFIVVQGNKLLHEDYNVTQLLEAISIRNHDNLDLTSKAGIKFMEPLLRNPATTLSITRAESSSYLPEIVKPAAPLPVSPTLNNESPSDYSDYDSESDNNKHPANEAVQKGDDAEIELDYKGVEEEENEVSYDIESDEHDNSHRAGAISFSFTNQGGHGSESSSAAKKDTLHPDEETKPAREKPGRH